MSRMKKKERRTFFMRVGAILIAVCMVAALALPAFAADTADEDYKYTVRIFPGNVGTIDGSTDPFVKEVEAGYKWSRSDFDYRSQAAPSDDKYYVSGMRESGKDNNTNVAYKGGAFTVDHDMDLVISYGIKGSDVAYTINYVDYGSGKSLRESETYYGNVGDKPAVAYLYIKGYVPQYENITGTLDADPANNEWTFYYLSLDGDSDDSTSTQSSGGVTTQSTGGTSTGSGTSTSSSTSSGTSTGSSSTSSGTSTGSSNSTGTTASNETSATSVGEPTTLASNGAVNTRKNGPVEIVDLDEQDIPLVEYDSSNADSNVEQNADELINRETEGVVRAEGMSTPVKVMLGAAVVIVIAAAGWFLYKKSSFEE